MNIISQLMQAGASLNLEYNSKWLHDQMNGLGFGELIARFSSGEFKADTEIKDAFTDNGSELQIGDLKQMHTLARFCQTGDEKRKLEKYKDLNGYAVFLALIIFEMGKRGDRAINLQYVKELAVPFKDDADLTKLFIDRMGQIKAVQDQLNEDDISPSLKAEESPGTQGYVVVGKDGQVVETRPRQLSGFSLAASTPVNVAASASVVAAHAASPIPDAKAQANASGKVVPLDLASTMVPPKDLASSFQDAASVAQVKVIQPASEAALSSAPAVSSSIASAVPKRVETAARSKRLIDVIEEQAWEQAYIQSSRNAASQENLGFFGKLWRAVKSAAVILWSLITTCSLKVYREWQRKNQLSDQLISARERFGTTAAMYSVSGFKPDIVEKKGDKTLAANGNPATVVAKSSQDEQGKIIIIQNEKEREIIDHQPKPKFC